MKKDLLSCKNLLFSLLFFFYSVTCAHGDVVYVTDQLLVYLRSEQGGGERVARLVSDTPLQLLEQNDRYAKVRTEEGQEGWIEVQYITTDPPQQIIIASLETEIKRLEATITQLTKERGPLGEQLEAIKREHTQQIKALEENIHQLQQEKDQLAGKLRETETAYQDIREKSGRVVQIADQLKLLQAENSRLEVMNRQLTQQNASFSKKSDIYWFFAGAGVLFLGWIIGRISRRRSTKLSI